MQHSIWRWLKLSFLLCAMILAVSVRAEAGTTVVTFDDIPDGLVPDGYGGINWGGQWTSYSNPQPPYTPESDPARVYTFDAQASMTFVTPGQVFDGAFFSGNAFATVQFEMIFNGMQVGLSGILAPSSTPTFLSSGYSGPVDEVLVLSPSPDFYVMDNVTYGTAAAVPEPSSIAMGGTALVLTGLALRRRGRGREKLA